MKKRILLVVLATVMCLSMALVSCTGKGKMLDLEFSDVFKSAPEEKEEFLSTTSTKLNMVGDISRSNNAFAVTKKAGSPNNRFDSRVYNLLNDTCILTVTNERVTDSDTYRTKVTNYYFDLIDEEYFAVLKEEYVEGNSYESYYSSYFDTYIRENADYSVAVYNKAGTEVHSIDNDDLYYSSFDNDYRNEMSDYIIPVYNYSETDLFYVGNKLYKYDDEGKKVFVKEFELEYKPNLEYMFPVGDYYCYMGDGYYSRGYSVQVFNDKLEPVANYSFPSYISTSDNSISFYALGQDRIFIQYVEALHQDEKVYDFRQGATGKYDLVTLILNIADNTVTELEDVNYKVRGITSTASKNADEDYYEDIVDNIAMITYIDENEHLDLSATNYEIVGLSNDGVITATIDIEGCISSLPVPYGNGLFFAPSAIDYNMYYIYDSQGEIIAYRDIDQNYYHGDYIYTNDAIYKLNGEKVYSIKGKEVYHMDGGSAIIYSTEDDVTTYSLFYNGQLKTIGSVGGESGTLDRFDRFNAYYYTYDNASNTYTYYNAKGDVIGTFGTYLSYEISTEDFLILSSSEYINGETQYNYYKFVKK